MRKKELFIILILLFSLVSVVYVFSVNDCSSDPNSGSSCASGYTCNDYQGKKICEQALMTGSCGSGFICTDDKTRCIASSFYPPKYKVCGTGKYCNLVSGLGSCVNDKSSGSSCSKDAECISNKCSASVCLTEGGGDCNIPSNCASNDCFSGKCRDNNNWVGDCPSNYFCDNQINSCRITMATSKHCASGYTCETQNGKASCVVQGSGIDWSKVGDAVNGKDDNMETTDVLLITEGTTYPGSAGDLCDNNNPCLIGHECYNGKCAYVNQPIPQYGWIGYGGCGDDYNLCKIDGTGCVSDNGNSIKKCLSSHYCYDNLGVSVSCDLKKQLDTSCGNNFECQSDKCEGYICSSGSQVECLDGSGCQINEQCLGSLCYPITDQSTDDVALDSNNWIGLCRIANYAPDNAKGWHCNNNLDKCISNSGELRKCVSTHYCKNGVNDFFDRCEEKFNVGQTCNQHYQCKSGKCENNKCVSTSGILDIDIPIGDYTAGLDYLAGGVLASDGEICIEDSNCVSGDCDKFDASDFSFGVCRSKNYWTGGCPTVYTDSITCGCASDGACKGPGGWLGLCSSETDKVYTCGDGYHCDSELKSCVENVDLKEEGESCNINSECNSGDCYNAGGSLGKICRDKEFWIGDCPSSTTLCLDDVLDGTSSCIAGFGRNGPVIVKTCASSYYCKGVSNNLFSCAAKKPSGTDCRIYNECLSGICFNNKCSVDQVSTDCGIGYTCSEDKTICVPGNQNNPLITCDSDNYCTSVGGSSSGFQGGGLFSDVQSTDSIQSFATCNNIKETDGAVCENDYECVSNDCNDNGVCGEQITPPLCGDGVCDSDETFSSCSSDCSQPLCGNAFCNAEETNANCDLDCPPTPSVVCGNNLCETGELATCTQDCQSCGSTTSCDSGEECVGGFCQQISCSQSNPCDSGQTCSNGVCQVTECSSSNPCFAGQVCDSNNNCQTANLCINTNCLSGQTCQSGLCVQQTCDGDNACSSGSYCGNNNYCQPIPKSCSSADGIICKSPAICDDNSKNYADSIELGCCVSKGTGNPGCTSAAIYIPTLGSSVKFEKSCVNGQTEVTVKDVNGQKIENTDGKYSKLGITSNPYIDYNDYSCNTGLTGDGAQPVYGYGILSLFLSLGMIGIYYILRRKNKGLNFSKHL